MSKLFLLAAAAAASLVSFGFQPVTNNASFTRDGVTYVQRGGLKNYDFVATNVDASAVSRVQSVNSKTGAVTLAYSDVGALPATTSHLPGDVPTNRTVNAKSLDANVTLDASDVSALPDDYVKLTNSATFKSAVETVSPPVELPSKWALANVTNASGTAVTAADVNARPSSWSPTPSSIGAWDVNGNNATTSRNYQYLYFKDATGEETLGYFNFGINGTRGPHVDLYDYSGDEPKKVCLDITKVSVSDGDTTRNISWQDILSQTDISQYVQPTNNPLSSKAISSYALLSYFGSEFKPWLWGEFLKKTDAETDYRTVADSYSKTGTEDLVKTGAVQVVGTKGLSIITGDGDVLTPTNGTVVWDYYPSGSSDVFRFLPNGTTSNEWVCENFGSTSAKLIYFGATWRTYVPSTSSAYTEFDDKPASAKELEHDGNRLVRKVIGATGYSRSDDVALAGDSVMADRRYITHGVYQCEWDWRQKLFGSIQRVTQPVPNYSSSSNYYFGNIVKQSNRYYMCLAEHMKRYQTPSASASYWLDVTPMYVDTTQFWKKTDNIEYEASSGSKKKIRYKYDYGTYYSESYLDDEGVMSSKIETDGERQRYVTLFAPPFAYDYPAEVLVEYVDEGGNAHYGDWTFKTNSIAKEDSYGQVRYTFADEGWANDTFVPKTLKVNGQPLTGDITIQGMVTNALVLTNGTLKTYDGTATFDAVTRSELTTTVNAVKDLHYDAGLNVTWTNVIHNGHIYYVTVTNANVATP